MPPLGTQILTLLLLAIPVASVTWTVTHENIARELRAACAQRSKTSRRLITRKAFYVFTCEYCFSHWVALVFLGLTGFKLVYMDWRGFLVAGFSLVWIANLYMSLFGRLRLEIEEERQEIATQRTGRHSSERTQAPRRTA